MYNYLNEYCSENYNDTIDKYGNTWLHYYCLKSQIIDPEVIKNNMIPFEVNFVRRTTMMQANLSGVTPRMILLKRKDITITPEMLGTITPKEMKKYVLSSYNPNPAVLMMLPHLYEKMLNMRINWNWGILIRNSNITELIKRAPRPHQIDVNNYLRKMDVIDPVALDYMNLKKMRDYSFMIKEKINDKAYFKLMPYIHYNHYRNIIHRFITPYGLTKFLQDYNYYIESPQDFKINKQDLLNSLIIRLDLNSPLPAYVHYRTGRVDLNLFHKAHRLIKMYTRILLLINRQLGLKLNRWLIIYICRQMFWTT